MDATVTDFRQQRGLQIAKGSRIRQIVSHTFLVPSQSTTGGYVVDTQAGTCTCPDHETRGETVTCKHRWAVAFVQRRTQMPDGEVVETMRVTYSQNWSAYNAAQTTEKDQFETLLRSLCSEIENPPQKGRGRPRAALSDLVFSAATKTFVGLSGRRATCDVRAASERGESKAPHYNTIFDAMERPDVAPVLKTLVQTSAIPLSQVESQFAADGTGFTTKTYKRWYDAKYGREMKESVWVHLHAMCGVKTNVLTSVVVTPGTLNDSPYLPQLVNETADHFHMKEVSADKGYSAKTNLAAIEAVNATPFIAFRSNAKPNKSDVWNRAYHMFAFKRDEWLEHYHQRSNVETAFSMIKRKFGGAVRAKSYDAMVNEVLLKCLCHNVSCLVHAIHELGIEPQFWTSPKSKAQLTSAVSAMKVGT